MSDETIEKILWKDQADMVKDLAKSGDDIKQDLTGLGAHLWHMASCIQGEAGELFDAIKKPVIYNKTMDIENVIEELGDVEFYLEGLRQGLEITREETIEANLKKLSKRYSSGTYSNEQAQQRADKEPEGYPEIREFSFMLENHDWDYKNAASPERLRAGEKEMQKIVAISELSSNHKRFYKDYIYFINGIGSNKNKPNPNDPKYLE